MSESQPSLESSRKPLHGSNGALVEGLREYPDSLQEVEALRRGETHQLAGLRQRSLNHGVNLLTIARGLEAVPEWSGSGESLDLRVLLPLIRELGESYLLMLGIESRHDALGAPLATTARLNELITPPVREWLLENADGRLQFPGL